MAQTYSLLLVSAHPQQWANVLDTSWPQPTASVIPTTSGLDLPPQAPQRVLLDWQPQAPTWLAQMQRQWGAMPSMLALVNDEADAETALTLGVQDYILLPQLSPLRLRVSLRQLGPFAPPLAPLSQVSDRARLQPDRLGPDDGDTGPSRVPSEVENMSDLKWAEAAWPLTQQTLQQALRFCNLGAWSWWPTSGQYTWYGTTAALLELPPHLPDMYQQWQRRIHPDDRETVVATIEAALVDRCPFALDYRYRLLSGQWVWRQVKGQGMYHPSGKLDRVLGILQDITPGKRQEQRLAGQQQTLEALAQGRPLPELLCQLVTTLEQTMVDVRGSILLLDGNCLHVGAAPHLPPAYVAAIDGAAIGPQVGSCGSAAHRQVPVISADIATDPLWVNFAEMAMHHGLRACWSFPILARAGHTLGTFALYRSIPGPPSPQDRASLTTAVHIASIAIEHWQATTSLQQSEGKLRALIRALPDLIMRIHRDGTYLDYFPGNYVKAFGNIHDVVGKSIDTVGMSPEVVAQRATLIEQALATGTVQVHEQTLPINGQLVDEEVRVVPCGSDEVLLLVRDITNRKRAEAQIQQQLGEITTWRNRYAAAGRASNQLLYAYDLATGQSTWGNTAPTLLGREVTYIDLPTYCSWIHPEDLPQFEVALAQLMDEVPPVPFRRVEYRLRHGNGHYIWVEDNNEPICDASGQLVQIVGNLSDITALKQANTTLQSLLAGTVAVTGEAFFPALAAQLATALGVATVIVSHRQNDTLYALATQHQGQPVMNFSYIIRHTPCEMTLDQSTYHCPEGVQQQFPIATDLVDLEANSYLGVAIRNSQDQIIGLICAVDGDPIADVAYATSLMRLFAQRAGAELERLQAEAALQDLNNRLEAEVHQRTQTLQQREQELATIFNQAAVGIVQTHANSGYFLRVNQRFCDLLGYSQAELRHMTFLDITHPDDQPTNSAVQRTILDDTANQCGFEKRYLTQGGTVLWCHVTVSVVRTAQGNPAYYITVIENITEVKQARAALEQINAKLEQRVSTRTAELLEAKQAAEAASQAKSRFLAHMSHELRTPLNAILGFSQVIAQDETLPEAHRYSLDIVNRSGEHLLLLINDILEMSKIEAGRVTLDSAPFDLPHLLTTVISLLQVEANAKGIALTLQWDSRLPITYQGDARKLRQVLLNLLGNSLKFTTSGGVHLRVGQAPPGAGASPGQVSLQFEVEDSGCGIASADIPHLFEPFVQGHAAQDYQSESGHPVPTEGTGLGLSISRQFVTLMGGELTLESTPGQGSTFRFTLPLPLVSLPPAVSPAPAARCSAGNCRVLVVENDSTNRLLLTLLLRELDLHVETATTNQEAVARWQQWRPHLVCMDLRMPGLDGWEAIRQIRTLEQQEPAPAPPPTQILVFTAEAGPVDAEAIQAAGANRLIYKPFTRATLTQALTDHLGLALAAPLPAGGGPLTVVHMAELGAVMPAGWLHQVRTAALQLDLDQLNRLVASIPLAYAHQQTALQQRIHDFDYDVIAALINQIDQLAPAPPLLPPSQG